MYIYIHSCIYRIPLYTTCTCMFCAVCSIVVCPLRTLLHHNAIRVQSHLSPFGGQPKFQRQHAYSHTYIHIDHPFLSINSSGLRQHLPEFGSQGCWVGPLCALVWVKRFVLAKKGRKPKSHILARNGHFPRKKNHLYGKHLHGV